MDELIDMLGGTHTWDPIDNLEALKVSLAESERIIRNHDHFAARQHAPKVLERYRYMMHMMSTMDKTSVQITPVEEMIFEQIQSVINMPLDEPMAILYASSEIDRHLLEWFE